MILIKLSSFFSVDQFYFLAHKYFYFDYPDSQLSHYSVQSPRIPDNQDDDDDDDCAV